MFTRRCTVFVQWQCPSLDMPHPTFDLSTLPILLSSAHEINFFFVARVRAVERGGEEGHMCFIVAATVCHTHQPCQSDQMGGRFFCIRLKRRIERFGCSGVYTATLLHLLARFHKMYQTAKRSLNRVLCTAVRMQRTSCK